MMERGSRRGFDVGHAPTRRAEPQERSSQDQAATAKKVADDIDAEVGAVGKHVAAMRNAVASADLSSWSTAKKAADEGVKQLKHLGKVANSAAKDATDPAVRERLAAAVRVNDSETAIVQIY